ncbi:MAG: DUF624 domain-containing protein [Ruminococcaceae bacterium]|nr:DUF624 domain-containing protein [Oscillospiraceae bacterium]
MKNSFDRITNSWLYKAGKAVGDVVIISLFFVLFCLPVVTIGVSISALYYTVYRKYTKKSDDISKDFFRAVRSNLKNGIIIHIIYSLYSAIVGFNIYFALFGFRGVRLPEWYTLISFIPVLPLIFSVPFLYPLVARFSNSVKETIKNSFTLCMINFPKFLLIWLIAAIASAICVAFPPAVLLIPTGAMYLTQMITEKAFASAINRSKSNEGKDDGNE